MAQWYQLLHLSQVEFQKLAAVAGGVDEHTS
jgi:hypothetical protein